MPDDEDDATLVAAAATGDAAAFETLVRRHTAAVWRVTRSMLGDDFAAEEAVQDAFLRAHRGLAGYRGDAAVRTWLLSIATRVCLDRLRLRRADVVPLDAIAEPGFAGDPGVRLDLERAVARLDADERTAFLLVDVLGYNRAEAAGIVGAPASTVRSRVARARERLAVALSPAVSER